MDHPQQVGLGLCQGTVLASPQFRLGITLATHNELQQAQKYTFYLQAIGQLLMFPEIERLQQTVVCNVENLIQFC